MSENIDSYKTLYFICSKCYKTCKTRKILNAHIQKHLSETTILKKLTSKRTHNTDTTSSKVPKQPSSKKIDNAGATSSKVTEKPLSSLKVSAKLFSNKIPPKKDATSFMVLEPTSSKTHNVNQIDTSRKVSDNPVSSKKRHGSETIPMA